MDSTNYGVIVGILLSLIIIAITLSLLILFSLTFFKILKTFLFGETISLVPYSKATEKMYEENFFLAQRGVVIARVLFKSNLFKSPDNPKGIVPCLNHKRSRYYPRRFNMTQPWPLKYWKDSKGRILLVHNGYRTMISLMTLFLVILLMLVLLYLSTRFLIECRQAL